MGHIAEELSLFLVVGCVGGGGGVNQIQDSVANNFVSYMYAPTFMKNSSQLKI